MRIIPLPRRSLRGAKDNWRCAHGRKSVAPLKHVVEFTTTRYQELGFEYTSERGYARNAARKVSPACRNLVVPGRSRRRRRGLLELRRRRHSGDYIRGSWIHGVIGPRSGALQRSTYTYPAATGKTHARPHLRAVARAGKAA